MGRSPLHPYSFCANLWGMPNEPELCKRGDTCGGGVGPPRKCFTFKVDDAAQPYADTYSMCIDADACQAAAKSYPGGAFCGP
jgi:hypothetical protein